MFYSKGSQLYTPSCPTVRMCSLLHLQQHMSWLLAGLGDLLEEPISEVDLFHRHLPGISHTSGLVLEAEGRKRKEGGSVPEFSLLTGWQRSGQTIIAVSLETVSLNSFTL